MAVSTTGGPPAGVQPGRGVDVADAGLVTPEAVVLGLPVASVGSRAVGLLVDGLIQVATIVLLAFAAGIVGDAGLGWLGITVFLLAVFGVLFVYPAAFETLWNGRTPGKAVMGLRVVTVEAAPVGLRHAAIRAAMGLLDFWVSWGGVAVISALLTRRAQRLGDLAAGTVVVREGRARGVTALRFDPPTGTEHYARQLDVAALDEADYLAIRSVLVRADRLTPAAVHQLASATLAAVSSRFTPDPPPGLHPAAVLQCLAAAYQQRHRARTRSDVSDWIWR